ncbi:hybrid sensor histidine kinase/response regulator transcription factor [Marinigracilibium pacificum]|uniref:histidine kinase n=1 Tax=Marinigracilibium pacificum TaxID=2729599 RepID=A0A848IZB6_9BACT|nr:two-component regulator propeller domain-containing protein [Marinigracilibium pacificum]NMM48488.1 response regulator [Marinigracilibium pacificum]
MKNCVFIVGLIISWISTPAQEIDKLYFHHVDVELTQNSVTRLAEDDNGFVWIATRYGLNRFDGEEIYTFADEGRNKAFVNGYVSGLNIDSQNNIWISTYGGGVFKLDDQTGKIEDSKFDFKNKLITNSMIDKDGLIWFSTEKSGVITYDPSSGKINTYTGFINNGKIAETSIVGIAQDQQENYLIGTWGKGLYLFNKDKKRFTNYTSKSNPSIIPHDVVRTMSKSLDGDIWIGFQKGLRKLSVKNGEYTFKMATDNQEFIDLIESMTILCLLHDSNNRLWIGTENEGLIILDLNTGNFERYFRDPYGNYSLKSNSIWNLMETKNGTILIGTFDQGLFKVDPYEKRFIHFHQTQKPGEAISYNLVSAFAEEGDGYYVGTDGGGLNYIQEGQPTKYFDKNNSNLTSNSILCLEKGADGRLWIGTWEGGVFYKDLGDDEIHFFDRRTSSDRYFGKYIFDLHRDSKDRIWFVSFRHALEVYDPKTNEFYSFTPSDEERKISSSTIHTIVEDHNGNIWTGTEGFGIDKIVLTKDLKTKQLINYSPEKPKGSKEYINHGFIFSLFIDAQNRLWAGTHGGGLNYFDDKSQSFKALTIQDGLPSNMILSIEQDDTGNLWVGTNNGLASIEPETFKIKTYGKADGLQGSEFTKRASLKLKNGDLLFGGINGYNRFNPLNIPEISDKGNVLITDIKFNSEEGKEFINNMDKSIINKEKITLPYKLNDFDISFAYLNYTQSNKNTYQYKLEGYDEEWQDAGTRNTAYYTNVSAGDYTFKVRAFNADGLLSEKQASLKIKITPPWYLSIWAYIVYFLIILTLLIWRRNTIIHREKLKTNLKLEHLELEKLKEMDELKSRFFANISHEFRTPLTLILSPLKTIYYEEHFSKHKNKVTNIIRQADRLLNLINQILDLSKLESGAVKAEFTVIDVSAFLKPIVYSFSGLAEKKNIRFTAHFPKSKIIASLDVDKLEKIVTNLLSNAIKYTPEFGEVNFELTSDDLNLNFSVCDTGEGISENDKEEIFKRYYQSSISKKRGDLGTGIGLALTKELVELHKGQIDVKNNHDKGTCFYVEIPLNLNGIDPETIIALPEIKRSIIDNHTELEDLIAHNEEQVTTNEESSKQKQTILIAEDNDDIRKFMSEFLSEDFNILKATNGVEALNIVNDQKPDLIISDIIMPEMDGYQLCNNVKKGDETNHIPIILLTAKASEESQEAGYSSGADAYLAKPFDPVKLKMQIKNMLKTGRNFKNKIAQNKHHKLTPKTPDVKNTDESFVEEIVAIIEKNISEPNFTINDICKEMGISRMQLYRRLKNAISMSANELIRHMRMQRAAQLMKQNKFSIAEITYQVGFTDLQYFRSTFKKQFGMNPSEFVSLKQ